jgi:hypothetical protein
MFVMPDLPPTGYPVTRGQGSNLPRPPITDSLRAACRKQRKALDHALPPHFHTKRAQGTHGANRPLRPPWV